MPSTWALPVIAVEATRRARQEVHLQVERKDAGGHPARARHADGSAAARPTVRAVTLNLRHRGRECTKYPRRGVLHDLACRGADLRRA